MGDRAGGDTGSVGTWSLTLGTPSSSGPYMPLAIRPAIGPTAPAITVAPPSLAITLAPDVTGSQTFDIGNTGEQIIWFNRFTPAPATFPFSLTQVQTLFRAADGAAVGQTFDVEIYTDADGDPANGAALAGSLLGQSITALETCQTYNLAAPLLLNGPGDVLVAVVNGTVGVTAATFPASIDQTASQLRSWVGFYGASPVPSPPPLPVTGTGARYGTIDSFWFAGNWMIRGLGVQGTPTGCAAPATVPWVSVTPTSGTTAPAGTSTVTVNYDPTGLVPAVYSALLCIDSNDPLNATLELPVTMPVSIPVDELFADGFEDPPPPP